MASNSERLRTSLQGLFDAYKLAFTLDAQKAGAILSASLESGGKTHAAQGLPGGSGINPDNELQDADDVAGVEKSDDIKFYVPILKTDGERQEITGVVLAPETVDAQGDIISAEVIEKAAGDFLAGFNRSTKLGFMHKEFNRRFELRQSYIAPSDMSIGSRVIKAGTWIMVVKVLESKIWDAVKSGKLTGFSIGGKAKVKSLDGE
jgi:hypothetical protein